MEIPVDIIKNFVDYVISELKDIDYATDEELIKVSNKLMKDDDLIQSLIDETFYEGVAALYTIRCAKEE